MGKKALFLDRDGVINVEKHYIYRREDFEFMPGIMDLCREAQRLGYVIIVVTNQSGIERGYYTQEDFERLTAYMREEFLKESVEILDVFSCPFLEHEDRKPLPGMLLKAKKKHGIIMEESIGVGDKERDIEAYIRAGVQKNYLLSSTISATKGKRIASLGEVIPFL